jgi:threonine dehydratase
MAGGRKTRFFTMLNEVQAVASEDIQAARNRLTGLTAVTPVVGLHSAPSGKVVRLKLESLQPIGSFKLRPVGNAVLSRTQDELGDGIYTSSSGNSALGVAYMARQLGIKGTAVVPANAPEAKLHKLRQLGADIKMLSVEDWWHAIRAGSVSGQSGLYIDAVRDPACLAGDATVGLEILEQFPDVEAIFVPFGGGGLACGIALALRAMKANVKVIACELATAHPCKSALKAGAPVENPYDAGFISGVGFGTVLPEMWPLIKTLIDGVMTVTIAEVAKTIKTLIEGNRIIAEGAGAIPVAAAMSGHYQYSRVCAVVSGGNLDTPFLTTILRNEVPQVKP